MTEKFLGKITNVHFGHVGYQDAGIGISLTLSGEGFGTNFSMDAWDPEQIPCSENSKWSEEDRNKNMSDIMRYVAQLLAKAKVSDFNQLKNIPVEVVFEDRMLKSWRILEEVL